MRPKKPCAVPLCPELVERGVYYCAHHKKQVEKKRWDHNYQVDPFYKTTRWKKLRIMILNREPLCRTCKKPARVVDHIVARSKGGAELDPDNLQALCDRCHNVKRAEESREHQAA